MGVGAGAGAGAGVGVGVVAVGVGVGVGSLAVGVGVVAATGICRVGSAIVSASCCPSASPAMKVIAFTLASFTISSGVLS